MVKRQLSRFADDLPDTLVPRQTPVQDLSEDEEKAVAADFFAQMRDKLN